MEELFNLGIDDDTIKDMLEINPEIKDMDELDIIKKKYLLMHIGCTDRQIINIISSNPEYLSRFDEDILKLIQRLLELGFSSLNILFDSNPYILNLDDFEINSYVNQRIKNGEKLNDIVDDLDSNPYMFNEF